MILVTEATGNVGGPLCGALKAAGARFRALAHGPQSAERLRGAGIDCVVGDTMDPKSLGPAFEGVEKVYLLSPPGSRLPEMEGNVVAAAKQAGVKHIVKHSGMGASPHAACLFHKWNGHAEYEIENSGLAWTILRPNVFLQNLGAVHGAAVAKSGAFHYYGGDAWTSWVDTRDVAQVALAVLTDSGHLGMVYELTGPKALSLDDVAARLTAKLGRTIRYVAISEAEQYRAMVDAGIPPIIADGVVGLQNWLRAGGGAYVTGTVERVTGIPPRSLDAYIDENRALFGGSAPVSAAS